MAARELQSAGISVEIIEARDRIGGRAWTDERMGRPLEMGATWVHWYQANVWNEIMRYNQPIVASPDPEKVCWNSAYGDTNTSDLQSYDDVIRPAMDEGFARGAGYFPEPLDPLWILSDDFDGPEAYANNSLPTTRNSWLMLSKKAVSSVTNRSI